MNKLKWWLRIVGGFYLLLGLVSAVSPVLDPAAYAETVATTLPAAYKGDPLAVTAVIDRDFWVTFQWVVLGVLMFIAARDPARSRFFIWAMVALEFFQYTVVVVVLMARGYPNMIPYLILHLLIGATGFMFLRQTKAE